MATKSKKSPAASTSTASPTLGQRLIAALIPRHFKGLTALHLAAQGPAYSTLNNWRNGTAVPDWPSVEAMARLVGRDPLELLASPSGDVTALRHHPDFAGALARALSRFPNRLPRTAYEVAGDTSAAQWPEHVDELFVFNLAQFWWTNASDLEVMRAEESEARAEMAAIDAKRGG
jgi:hypothetical protein